MPIVNCLGFNEKQAKEYLQQPGAIEQFKSREKSTSKTTESDTPPLVKQAEKFALYLNPPEPKQKKSKPKPKKTRRRSPAVPDVTRKPERSSVKFDLLGTSYFQAEPSLSFALVDMPGKGLRWVQQSSEIGHLEVEEIKDGSIIVKDNQRTEEVFVPQPEKTNLLKGKSGQERTGSKSSSYESTKVASGRPEEKPKPSPGKKESPKKTARKPAPPPEAVISDAKRARLGKELMSQMQALNKNAPPDKRHSEELRKKQKELIKEMFEKLDKASDKNSPGRPGSKGDSTKMNPRELRKLQRMGKELDKNNKPKSRDPNDSNSAKTRK